MRGLIFSLALCLGAGEALAQRPSTLDMTCADVQAFIASNGAVVMSTGQYTYDRYVATRAQCLPGDVMRNRWVPAADTPECKLRVCVPRPPRPSRR
jgi:hypothetical protein